jgi:hypothetical protein
MPRSCKIESGQPFDLADKSRQEWMRRYHFAPRGIGFLEPGVLPLDHPEMGGYNIAKSAYQIRPDVFNLDWLSGKTKIPAAEIGKRLSRMYNDHLIMLVMNPATQVYGWGLYYWFVKLRAGTPRKVKEEFTEWYQAKDQICSGYETAGGFDFFNGNHMRVLDNLLWDVVLPLGQRPEVEYVRLAPVRRDIREDHMNMWDAPDETYREYLWGAGEAEKLAKIQKKLDPTDISILMAINQKRPVSDYFDFPALAEISGLDAEDLRKGMEDIIEHKRILVPLVFLNWQKLGLTQKMFAVRLFQIVPCYRKAEIADSLAQTTEFSSVWEFTDSHYDIGLMACNQTTDIDALRKLVQSIPEVEAIDEADVVRQYRRWVCRLDDQRGFWEECVFTDDFLQDFSVRPEVRS